MANILASIAPELCGVLRQRYTRCNKPGCVCAKGQLHGPHYYLQYRKYKQNVGWVRASKYVAASDVADVQAQLDDARQFTKAALNEQYRKLKARVTKLESMTKEAVRNDR